MLAIISAFLGYVNRSTIWSYTQLPSGSVIFLSDAMISNIMTWAGCLVPKVGTIISAFSYEIFLWVNILTVDLWFTTYLSTFLHLFNNPASVYHLRPRLSFTAIQTVLEFTISLAAITHMDAVGSFTILVIRVLMKSGVHFMTIFLPSLLWMPLLMSMCGLLEIVVHKDTPTIQKILLGSN